MTVRSPFDPDLGYLTALSLSTQPGIRLPDGRVFGLTFDAAFRLSLDFPGFLGTLDNKGEAQVNLWLPYLPWLKGLRIHVASVTFDLNLTNPFRQLTAPNSYVF